MLLACAWKYMLIFYRWIFVFSFLSAFKIRSSSLLWLWSESKRPNCSFFIIIQFKQVRLLAHLAVWKCRVPFNSMIRELLLYDRLFAFLHLDADHHFINVLYVLRPGCGQLPALLYESLQPYYLLEQQLDHSCLMLDANVFQHHPDHHNAVFKCKFVHHQVIYGPLD